MDDFIKKVSHNICKKILKESVIKSNNIRQQLSFIEHVKLYESINDLSYEKSIEIVFELGVRDYESKFGRLLKIGLAGIAGGLLTPVGIPIVAGFGIGTILAYSFKKVTDPCVQACRNQQSDTKNICKYNCFIYGCDRIIRDIKSQMSRCNSTKNPGKCEKRLTKSLSTWQIRKEKYKEKLEYAKEVWVKKEAIKRLKKLRTSQNG